MILISSGDGKIHGTPFDGPINEYSPAMTHDQQQKARMPFVTVLRARQRSGHRHISSTRPPRRCKCRGGRRRPIVPRPHTTSSSRLCTGPRLQPPAADYSRERPQPEPVRRQRRRRPLPNLKRHPLSAAVTTTNVPAAGDASRGSRASGRKSQKPNRRRLCPRSLRRNHRPSQRRRPCQSASQSPKM